ncbi:MAG: protease modulator HflC [Verrucomicrobiales bacterium]
MTKAILPVVILILGLLALLIAFGGIYTVSETDQVILTQFGRPIRQPITDPGLHFKIPFIQKVNRIDKRFLEWAGSSVPMPTKDKTYILVETFARWRIIDPTTYFVKLGNERSAQSRLEDILGSETRTAIARHDLIELVRTDKTRKPVLDETLTNIREIASKVGQLPDIQYGRELIASEIEIASAKKLQNFGLQLLDLRFKRVNYNNDVLLRIYDRMKSERLQIAERYRSEGAGEAARIIGQKERDLNEIESTAYKEIQRLRGEADAKATEIYAKSYSQSAQSAEFYKFTKTLETYKTAIQGDTSLVLTTESDLFHLLKNARPDAAPGVSPPSTPAPAPSAPAPSAPASPQPAAAPAAQ